MKTLIDDREIVVCKSDEDGKIIILNYTDYNEIVIQERNDNFNKPSILSENITSVKSKLDNWMSIKSVLLNFMFVGQSCHCTAL